MATYAKEKGFTVQTLSTDPVASQAAGGSWASGGNTNSNHSGYGGSSGTYNAALVASNEPYGANVELYDGSSWTETGNLNTSRTSAYSAGTQPATWLGGGRTGPSGSTNNTETFNGSSWTEVNEMNTTRFSSGSTGTYTAGIAVAGNTFTDVSRAVETWNGTTWSTHPNDYDTDVAEVITFGTTTAAIMAGGFDGPAPRGGSNNSVTTAYSYDGSTYTSITALPQTLNSATGTGSQTDAIAAGGNRYPADNTANTVAWNGTSWSQVQDVPTAAYAYGGSKATTSTENQLAFCGQPGAATSTFEWSAPSTFTKTIEGQLFFNSTSNAFKVTEFNIPGATWASGGSLPTVKSAHGYAGTQTAGVAFAGATSTTNKVATSYEYNGSAWSDANSVNTTRDLCAGAGTQTAAILFGGTLPPGGHSNATELYDGTNWTTSPGTFNSQARSRIGPIGTQTAALAVSGTPISPVDKAVESWNGSSWTEIAEFNTSRINGGAAGIQTAGLFFGGEDPLRALTESWDGTAWTEVADLNTARQSSGMGAGDSNTSAICIGGEVSPGFTANTESWNGSSWTEVANLAQARGYLACGGTPTSAIATGGRNPGSSFLANTEEFTAGLSNFTITSS